LVVAHFCLDGPYYYSASNVKLAENAVADKIDSMVVANSGGVNLFVSYIDSSSFQHTALTIKVPAIAAAPLPPPVPHLSDPYKQAAAMDKYKKDYGAWQKNYASWQNQVAIIRSQVKQETDVLRSLPPHVDTTGSSVWGCLDTASLNFEGVSGKKVLLIASALMQNQHDQVPPGFTLAGVSVEVVFHNCITFASVCAQNDANWKHIFKQYGASSVSFASVQESQVSPIRL
jgi:hypothetical protein